MSSYDMWNMHFYVTYMFEGATVSNMHVARSWLTLVYSRPQKQEHHWPLQRSHFRAKKSWLSRGWLDQQGPVRVGNQAYIGSKTRLPRAGGISSKGPTWQNGGEYRARAQHFLIRSLIRILEKVSGEEILIRSLEKVAGEAEGENGGWKIKLIIFVGCSSRSVNVQIFNDNLIEQ